MQQLCKALWNVKRLYKIKQCKNNRPKTGKKKPKVNGKPKPMKIL